MFFPIAACLVAVCQERDLVSLIFSPIASEHYDTKTMDAIGRLFCFVLSLWKGMRLRDDECVSLQEEGVGEGKGECTLDSLLCRMKCP